MLFPIGSLSQQALDKRIAFTPLEDFDDLLAQRRVHRSGEFWAEKYLQVVGFHGVKLLHCLNEKLSGLLCLQVLLI